MSKNSSDKEFYVMDVIDVNIEVVAAFGNLYRKRCVLIAVQDADGKILTGAKPSFFPPSITRLLGGGVDEGEDLELAAVRELSEELGVKVDVTQLMPLAQFNTHATDSTGKAFYNETYLYGVNIGDATYRPGDDVKQIIALSKDELYNLATAFEKLPTSLWYRGEEGDFSWEDYGKLYSQIHRVAADKMFAR